MKIEPKLNYGLEVPDTLDGVIDSIGMYSLNLPVVPPEDDRPRLPYNFVDLPVRSLSALLSRISGYYEYIATIWALFDTLQANFRDSLDVAMAEAYINSKGTIEQRRNLAKVDPKVVDLRERYVNARTKANLIEKASMKPLSKDFAVVSRAISARDQETRFSNRESNVGDSDIDDGYDLFKD